MRRKLRSIAAAGALCVAAAFAPVTAHAQLPDIGYDPATATSDLATQLGTNVGTVVGFAFAMMAIFFAVKLVRRHLLRAG